MARITKDYTTHSKDDLQAEADARGLTVSGSGANAAVLKDDLVIALEDNDTTPDQPPHPLPKLKATPIPQVALIPPPSRDGGNGPSDEDYTEGLYTKDGEDWAVAIANDAPGDKTHFAKNSAHFWNGTKEEFKAQFEKK